jgi:hypothetical protein
VPDSRGHPPNLLQYNRPSVVLLTAEADNIRLKWLPKHALYVVRELSIVTYGKKRRDTLE